MAASSEVPTVARPSVSSSRYLRKALAEIYTYHRRHEQLLANFTRDAQANPYVCQVLEPRVKLQERMRDVLAAGWEQEAGRRNRLLYGAMCLSLDFRTWHILVRQQAFEVEEVIELMVGMERCLLRPSDDIPTSKTFLTGELPHQELGHSNVDKRVAEVQHCQTPGASSAKLCDETDPDALISDVAGVSNRLHRRRKLWTAICNRC
jgi:hypothetical protein